MERKYTDPVPEYAHVMTLEEWLESKNVFFGNYDGSGYWIKDNLQCRTEEVFSSKPEDATHVAWYNK